MFGSAHICVAIGVCLSLSLSVCVNVKSFLFPLTLVYSAFCFSSLCETDTSTCQVKTQITSNEKCGGIKFHWNSIMSNKKEDDGVRYYYDAHLMPSHSQYSDDNRHCFYGGLNGRTGWCFQAVFAHQLNTFAHTLCNSTNGQARLRTRI